MTLALLALIALKQPCYSENALPVGNERKPHLEPKIGRGTATASLGIGL